jgi:mannose-6-phosphate isomerase-like protein (cupin superfamily)
MIKPGPTTTIITFATLFMAGAAMAQMPAPGPAAAPAATPAAAAGPAPATEVKSDESKVLTTADVLDVAKNSRVTKATDPMVATNLVTQLPYRVNVEHRIAGTTPPSIHEKNAEMFFVVDGDGVVNTGGKLVDPVRRGNNILGTSIVDGQSRAIHKGDVVFVPAGTPHQIADVKTTLTMVVTMLPNVTPSQ